MNIISQNGTQVKQVEFFVIGGDVEWESCPECGRIVDAGESCPTCDMLRNPANVRTFLLNGQSVEWESCPDCGRIVDAGESCDCIPFLGEPCHAGQGGGGAQDYGLEARG